MSTKNKNIVQEVNSAFSKGDLDAFLAYCAYDVRWIMAGSHDMQGHDAIRQFMKDGEGEAAPEINIAQMIGEGNTVLCEGKFNMIKKTVR